MTRCRRPAHRLVTGLCAVALVGAWLLLTGAPAGAVEAQGLRLDPVEQVVLGDGSVLRPALPPGGAVVYPLRLRNTRDVAVEALVYGADADGAEIASGADNDGVGAWITADQTRVPLAAEATTVVEVTVRRPTDDDAGGRGAVVVQLSEASRQELGLEVVQRAALPVEVAADGSGDGLPVEVVDTEVARGLVPGDVVVEVVVTNPGADPAAPATVVAVERRFGEEVRVPVEVGTVAPGATVTTTAVVDVPWWGLVAPVRAEAASVGLTTVSAPARVTVVPGWAVLLLIVTTAAATLRARRRTAPFELGRVPVRAEREEPTGADHNDDETNTAD